MTAPFAHVEILGPRASLDSWLAVIQDHGACHIVDALQGLEGESGIGRPLPASSEREGTTLRSATAHRLRSVERILPGTAVGEDASARPAFTIGYGGEGRVDLETHCRSASTVAGRLVVALEGGRAADKRLLEAEAVRLAVAAFRARGWDDLDGVAFAWPLDTVGLRGLQRRFRRLGAEVGKAEGPRQVVLALKADATRRGALLDMAHEAGGHDVVWPPDVREDPARAGDLAESSANAAREADKAAMATLRRSIDDDGAEARALLDALEDADQRETLHRRLAATEFVAAVRAYVRREDLASLERALEERFGKEVVLRRLPPGPDEPTVPRAVAGLPFTALRGLSPKVYGSVSAASLLALAVPLAVGVALADVGAGFLMLVLGGFLGIGAAAGSPRRDTSLLAQVGGFVSLVLGGLLGRAFGDLGVSLLGSSWAIAPAFPTAGMSSPRVFVLVVGSVAALAALWGGAMFLAHLVAHRPARAREAALGALHLGVVAGAAAAFVGSPPAPLHDAWWLVPAGIVLVIFLAGGRGLGRLLLDLVGVARLVAVAFLACTTFAWATGTLAAELSAHPLDIAPWVLLPLAILVTLLAAIVDPAHVAMGVPYDLSLGGRGLGQPFTPFARRVVRGRSLGRGDS